MEEDFRIGDWLVQPLRDIIESPEKSISLEPKAMDLLVYLAQHQGEVIPKERLIQAVWEDAFVTDEVLTNNVWKLRQALGDDSKNPKFIQTIPRRGYQLCADVVWEDVREEASLRYEIGKKIGQGAMGEVYLADDTLLRRKVALKFVREELDQEGTWHRRLVREARSAAALDHPFICKVYDTGQLEGRIFIAMEFVKGESLKEILKGGPLDIDLALQIVNEAAEALDAAHENGLVHRDIKPSNFMLTEQGHVKLMDFGVAKRLRPAAGDSQDWTGTLTAEGSALGTVPYMSPEQVRGQELDPRSDIFSLGVVFYEMLTGFHPFRRGLSADTAAAVLNEHAPPLSRYRKGLPAGLQKLIDRMLAKDREARYKSLQQLGTDLSEINFSDSVAWLPRVLWRPYWKPVVSGVVLIAAAWTSLFLWSLWETPPSQPMSRPIPLTSNPGIEMTPAVSADGNFVAYARDAGASGSFDIYAQVIGTSEPLQRTSDPADDLCPTWSPDGSQIAFLRRLSETEYSVFVVPVLGGSEVRVADLGPDGFWEAAHKGLSWSPDGQDLAIVEGKPNSDGSRIFLLDVETRARRELAVSPETSWFGLPVFSPEGKALAFVQYTPEDCSLCIREIDTGELECLPAFNFWIWDMDWTPDGQAIVYTSGLGPDRRLWRLSLEERVPELLPFGEDAMEVSISRTGGRLVYQIWQQDMSLWRASGPTASQAVAPVKFLASSTRNDRFPEYSPDGEMVVFESSRTGDYQLWISNADGTKPRKLTSVGLVGLGGRWSPGGDRIAFCGNEDGEEVGGIFVVDSEGGPPVNLTPDEFNDGQPSWSSDGKWIYYESERQGIAQIFRVAADGGEPEQLTKGHDKFPRELDGYLLLFWRDGRIWSLELDSHEERLVLDKEVLQPHWTVWRGQLVYSTRVEEEGAVIEMLNPTTGEKKELGPLGQGTEVGYGLTVSPDGESILFSQAVVVRADLMMVENFD